MMTQVLQNLKKVKHTRYQWLKILREKREKWQDKAEEKNTFEKKKKNKNDF